MTFGIEQAQIWAAVLIAVAASAEDLLRRNVSNCWPLAALAAGIGTHALARGWKGAGLALAGAAAGFAIFLVRYVFTGIGGGDVKLVGGFGAFVGLSGILPFVFWTTVIGGIAAAGALGVSVIRRRWAASAASPAPPASIPYAPAIGLGVWLTLLSAK